MRVGNVTPEDWQFYQTRVLSQLTPVEQRRFANAISLFTTNKEVRERNTIKLEELNSPVARIVARYCRVSEAEGEKVQSDYCGGLQHSICLAVGSRVCDLLYCDVNF